MNGGERFQEGQRVVVLIHDPKRIRPYTGFVVRDAPPWRVLVQLDGGVRMSVDREHVRRDGQRLL